MKQIGIDKIKQTIDDVLEIIPDIQAAKESDDKITIMEGGVLAIKHGGKAIRFFSSVEDIAKEVINIDDVEASELFDQLQDHFGGSDEAKAAIKEIVSGAASISQGVQGLIKLKG